MPGNEYDVAELLAQPLTTEEEVAVRTLQAAGHTSQSIASIVTLCRMMGHSLTVFALTHPLVLRRIEAPNAAHSGRKQDS